jgi:hypothetical protein
MSSPPREYNFESEMAGLYAGGVMGGLVLGSFGDLIQSEGHTMLWYIVGTVVGAVGGAIAAALFRRFVQDAPVEEHPTTA